MEKTKIGNRGISFTFHELNEFATYVYLINTESNIFIVDTFLGPKSMNGIKRYILGNFPNKNIIIFNTHFHWDHIWGNCAFPNSDIIAHSQCRKNIQTHSKEELEKFKQYRQGEVAIVYPNITFEDRLIFHNDGIEIFYSPGHSVGSASLYDKIDKVLYVGDNVEFPIPYFCDNNFDEYINTLEKYLTIDFEMLLTGHSGAVNRELLMGHIEYIKDFKAGNYAKYEKDEYKNVHLENVKVLL